MYDNGAQPEPELNEAQRKLVSRDIRKWKVWVGVLLVSLPIGIASGVEQCAWLPTLVGRPQPVTNVRCHSRDQATTKAARSGSAMRCGAARTGRRLKLGFTFSPIMM